MAIQVAGMMFFMYWCKKTKKGYTVNIFFIKILKVVLPLVLEASRQVRDAPVRNTARSGGGPEK